MFDLNGVQHVLDRRHVRIELAVERCRDARARTSTYLLQIETRFDGDRHEKGYDSGGEYLTWKTAGFRGRHGHFDDAQDSHENSWLAGWNRLEQRDDFIDDDPLV